MISFLIEDNEIIHKFLNGDDSNIPVSEFMYLHTRPLLRPNFLTQIDDLVNKVGRKIVAIKLTGKPIDDLTGMAIRLGQAMDGEITEVRAQLILLTLRDIWKLCIDLDKRL